MTKSIEAIRIGRRGSPRNHEIIDVLNHLLIAPDTPYASASHAVRMLISESPTYQRALTELRNGASRQELVTTAGPSGGERANLGP